MKWVLCSVYDTAAKWFDRPFAAQNEAVAQRAFVDELNRVDGARIMSAHPEDFDLYVVAIFDDQNGEVKPFDVKSPVLRGRDVKGMRS